MLSELISSNLFFSLNISIVQETEANPTLSLCSCGILCISSIIFHRRAGSLSAYRMTMFLPLLNLFSVKTKGLFSLYAVRSTAYLCLLQRHKNWGLGEVIRTSIADIFLKGSYTSCFSHRLSRMKN